jgi:ribosome-associated toxin RatA of RatAB toxin-antitoxin module
VRNLLCLLASISFCAFANPVAAEPEATPGEWKLVSTTDNVALYRRPRSGPGHYETRATGEIAASTAVVHAVLDDAESYPRFMPYTVECRVLKREGDSVLTYQRISAPLVSDRDYTLRVRTTSKTVEGGTSYRSRWETENAAGPAEKPGVIRVKLCEGGWLLEPVGPNTTRATYSVYTDSGGVIPAFIKNTGSQIGIRKIFAALRKQVLDPKYKSEAGSRITHRAFRPYPSDFPLPTSNFESPASSIRTRLSR